VVDRQRRHALTAPNSPAPLTLIAMPTRMQQLGLLIVLLALTLYVFFRTT
jgi:hypothetical protein